MMNNYIENRTIFYSVLIKELTEKEFNEVYKQVSHFFACTDDERILKVIGNPIFQQLSSAQAIVMHLNFVSAFCFDRGMFGMNTFEKEVLNAKLDALRFVESIMLNDGTITPLKRIIALNKDRDVFSTLIAMVRMVSGQCDSKSKALLGKGLKSGDIDAGLLLLNITSAVEEKKAVLAQIKQLDDSAFYYDVIKYYLQQSGIQV